MTVNRHKGSGNRTLSGANSNPPTFAINRVFSSARSSQARSRRLRPAWRQRCVRLSQWCRRRRRPSRGPTRWRARGRPQRAYRLRPTARHGGSRFRRLRRVPQHRTCHPPVPARQSCRLRRLGICRTAARRRFRVSLPGHGREQPGCRPRSRSCLQRRRFRGRRAARPPRRRQPGNCKGRVCRPRALPCPQRAACRPQVLHKWARRSPWMAPPRWRHAVLVVVSTSAVRDPMARAP